MTKLRNCVQTCFVCTVQEQDESALKLKHQRVRAREPALLNKAELLCYQINSSQTHSNCIIFAQNSPTQHADNKLMDAFLKRQPKAPAATGAADTEMADETLMTKAADKPRFVPWVEKYRPTKVEEVSHQLEVVSALRQSVKTGQVPHLLLHGPPGTGKTSTILALAKELFGTDFYRQRVLELNASDERGIAVVREKVKKFAQRKIAANPMADRNIPQLQFVILDEADSMTLDAQAALRRIIEAYSATTRFCVICNYVCKIIDPLASRCVKFRFSPIGASAQFERLSHICTNEGVKLIGDDVLNRLIELTEGDMRRSINTLQTCASFGRTQALTVADVESVSGIVPRKVINKINVVLETKGATFTDVSRLCEDLILQGWDCQQLLNQLLEYYLAHPGSASIKDYKKARISELLASTEYQLIQGGNEELNLVNTLSQVAQTLSEK